MAAKWWEEDKPVQKKKQQESTLKQEKKSKEEKKKESPPKKVERIVTKPKERKVKTRNGEVTVENKKDRKVPEDIKVKEKVSVGMDALKGIIAGLIDEKLKNMVVQGQGEIPIMQRSQPSVEIKFDGKDKVSWTVKAYADTVEQAFKEAEAVHDTMMEENGEDEDE